jgi:ABC-type multidrug transport system ATPase subunit
MQQQERLHALDTVRAFALLAGIVLHAAMSFMPGLAAFGFPADSSQSPALQIVFYVIHVFRMPLFFFLAGYFAHLTFHRQGAAGFTRDRAKRIALPLVVGWVLFGPLAMMGVYLAFGPEVTDTPPPAGGFPLSHLWFLYYLLLIYAGAIGARALVIRTVDREGHVRENVDMLVRHAVNSYTAPVLLAMPIAVCLYLRPDWVPWAGIPTPDTGLTPQLPAMIGYGTAFVFGWLMRRQADLLGRLQRGWVLHAIAAIALTAASLRLAEQVSNPFAMDPAIKTACAICYTLAAWNWAFALMGAALRFFDSESAIRRYLADASYWMYLAHLPLVFALQLVVRKWPLHWSIKFPLIVVTAVVILLLTYQFFVRNTLIGEVLNGRRRSGNVPPTTVCSVVANDVGECVAELLGVRKSYDKTQALNGIDLQIRRGEVLALLGQNGAGKSTVISLLLGLQQPDDGTVRLFGERFDSPDIMVARREVGVMLQDVALPHESRVHELIELSSSYYSSPFPLDEVLKLTRSESIAQRPYGKLSGGQQRLAQFAMAICGRPRLLFLDEPTTGLDVQAREVLWNTVRELVRNGCSVVLTTHYLEEAEALADRVAVLARGRIVATGSVAEIRAVVSRKRIRCVTSLHAEQIRHWPGVTEVCVDGSRFDITTSDAELVTRRLLMTDAMLTGLEVSQAGLAEALIELTREAA